MGKKTSSAAALSALILIQYGTKSFSEDGTAPRNQRGELICVTVIFSH
jgi:hypothetical protein